MWETGSISIELEWTLLVLITKGNSDTPGIGMLEVFWRVVEAVIDTPIKSLVQFHDVLHGVFAGGGEGTANMQLKLVQELARVNRIHYY